MPELSTIYDYMRLCANKRVLMHCPLQPLAAVQAVIRGYCKLEILAASAL
jgi:hypothetical protein